MLHRPSGITITVALIALVAGPIFGFSQAFASEPFLGEIKLFGGNFAPRGYAKCDGQLLPISSNTALFSILGTTYGGDGESTFGLPDLRGRTPIHVGQGPGLSNRVLGAKGGAERVTLTQAQIPPLTLQLKVTTADGNQTSPSGHILANDPREDQYSDVGMANATTKDGSVAAPSCLGQSHENMAPFQVVTYIIALSGTFPSRN